LKLVLEKNKAFLIVCFSKKTPKRYNKEI